MGMGRVNGNTGLFSPPKYAGFLRCEQESLLGVKNIN